MPDILTTLAFAKIGFTPYKKAASGRVYLTTANQLVGSHAELTAYRSSDKGYAGWQSHHVVETQDLGRLNIAEFSPTRNDQFCVLLPKRAHVERINSMLRRHAPIGSPVNAALLLQAYREACDLVGDYCGGGERLIRQELFAVVQATFKAFQLI